MSKPTKRRHLNPGLGIGTEKPTVTQCRQATEVLMREHLYTRPAGVTSGALSRYIAGGPDVMVFTVSGELIEVVNRALQQCGMDLKFSPRETAVDVKPVSDRELIELRKIAGLTVK